MFNEKLKIIITDKEDGELIEAGIIRIKYPTGLIEDVILVESNNYKKIIACLNIVHKIDKEFTIRLILTCGDCFFPLNEVQTTKQNVYWDFQQFLEKHAYIKNLYEQYLSENESKSTVQRLLNLKNTENNVQID